MAVLRPSDELQFDSDYDAEHERNARNRQVASDGSTTKNQLGAPALAPTARKNGGSDHSSAGLSDATPRDQELSNQVGVGVHDDLFEDAAEGTTTNE